MQNSSPGCFARHKLQKPVNAKGNALSCRAFPSCNLRLKRRLRRFIHTLCRGAFVRGISRYCEKRTAFVCATRGLDECEAFVFPSDPTSAAALDQLFGQSFVFRYLVCPRIFYNNFRKFNTLSACLRSRLVRLCCKNLSLYFPLHRLWKLSLLCCQDDVQDLTAFPS